MMKLDTVIYNEAEKDSNRHLKQAQPQCDQFVRKALKVNITPLKLMLLQKMYG